MEGYRTDPGFMRVMESYLTGERRVTRKTLESMLEKYPGEPSLLLLLGNVQYSLGNLQESARHYRKALEVSPGFCQAWYKLGVCLVRMGQLNEALDAFKRNVESNCDGHAMSWYWIGLIHYFLGKDKEALEAFSVLHRESKESRLANLFLAQLLMKRNRHAEALTLLQELLELTPDFAEVHYLVGQSYAGMFRNMEAIQSFRKTLELNPDDSRAQMSLEQYTTDSPY